MLRRLPFVACLLALVPGCYSKITAYEGNFTIGYASAVQIENFVKPIAPGAKLDLVVFANGTSNKLSILEAASSKPGVVEVVAVKGTTLVVAGVAPGVSELTIAARDANGRRVADKMFFHVAKPATHGIEHICTEEPKAAYIRGTELVVFHNLATSDKRPVIGYDYVPLAISPASALEFVAQPQAGTVYRYRAAKSEPAVTIRSKIDDKRLTARIVDPSEIKSARLFAPERMLAGGSAYVVGHVELADGTPVCSQNALTRAKSLTPEICKVSAKLEDSLDDTNREQLAEVDALKYGTCQLEMTLPELGDRGLVLKQSIKIGRVEYPSSSEGAVTARGRPTWPSWLFLGVAQLVGLGVLARRVRERRRPRTDRDRARF